MILSMSLPDNGAAVLMKALRQDPAYWNIPVLATITNGENGEEMPLALQADEFLCKLHPLTDLRRRVQRLADIAEFRVRERSLRDEACRDYLTGLLNRRGFQTETASFGQDDYPLAVCLFDLDNLKIINDKYGHYSGDRIIRAFADLLCNNAGNDDILCRYGGDEFIVVFKHLCNEESAIKKASDICRLFQGCLEKEQYTVSSSCGVAFCATGTEQIDKLIQRADQALYSAKEQNKGGARV